MASVDSANIKSYTSRAGNIHATTDGTQVTGLTIPTNKDRVYFVNVKVDAVQTTDFSEVGSYWRQATFKNDGGTLTLIGSVRTIGTDNESTAGWDVTLDANSTNIRVRLTGAAATNITWVMTPEVIEVGYQAYQDTTVTPNVVRTGWFNG